MSIAGLVGLWRLDKGSGLTAFDTSGYGNDGALVNNPAWVNGISGKAITFDGLNQAISLPNAGYFGVGVQTLSFWIKPAENPSSVDRGFPFFHYSADNRFYVEQFSNGIIRITIGTNVVHTLLAASDYSAGDQLHIVVIRDYTNLKVHGWVNAIKKIDDVTVVINDPPGSAAPSISRTAEAFLGVIDEVRIYNRALSKSEIELLYEHPDGYPGAQDGIQLKLISPSGELVSILSDTDLSGQILNIKIKEQKTGGVQKFSFRIPRNIDVPITRNTECHFFVNGILWKNGYIKEIPKPDQDLPVLIIEGEGFCKRLLKKVINETYTAKTLDFIVKDIGNTYLGSDIGVFYDVAKITVPVISGITIEFKNKNLYSVFETLLEIANHDYENNRYRFYVDNEKELVFELLSNDLQDYVYEGHQFQKPEISVDTSKIINKILAFRTISGTPKEVEYVAAYQDTESQGRFGLFEKKITFPDYIDTTTIGKITTFLLKRKSSPENKVKIENFEVDEVLPFGKYGISNRRELYWRLIADCDTLEGWNVTGFSNTSIELSETHVLTGKRSLKITTAAGSYGEYIEFTSDNIISLPQEIRAFIYFQGTSVPLRITFFDAHGNEVSLEAGSTNPLLFNDQWKRFIEIISQVTATTNMLVDPNGAEEDLIISYDAVDDYELDIRYEILTGDMAVDPNGDADDFIVNLTSEVEGNFEIRNRIVTGLLEIQKIRITILTNSSAIFYIDRLDTFANIYNFHELQLEEIEYILSSVGLFANVNFGEKEDNILDEIKDQVKEGNTALEIFSKE